MLFPNEFGLCRLSVHTVQGGQEKIYSAPVKTVKDRRKLWCRYRPLSNLVQLILIWWNYQTTAYLSSFAEYPDLHVELTAASGW